MSNAWFLIFVRGSKRSCATISDIINQDSWPSNICVQNVRRDVSSPFFSALGIKIKVEKIRYGKIMVLNICISFFLAFISDDFEYK